MNKSLLLSLLTLVSLSLNISSAECQIVGQNQDTLVLDRVLAVVGGHPIFQSDVENEYTRAKAMGYAIPGDMKCSILESILVGKLLLDQAEIDSIEVSDNEVENNVKRRIQGILQQAQGNEDVVTQLFNKSMLEIEQDLHKPIKEQMLTERMQNKITSNIKVTPSEVQKFYRNLNKEEIPLIPETIEIKQIVLKPEIPAEEIQRIKDRLNQFRDQIQQGQKMSTLAVLYSEDPGSQPRGGELGLMPRGQLVPEFTAVAYNLKKGDISRIVETDFGYHIIELIERKGDMINARHILLKPKVPLNSKIEVKNQLDSIANKIRVGEITFEEAARAYSEDEKSRTNGGIVVNPETATTRFEPKDLDPALMNAMRNLKVGEISEPFESADETGNIVFKVISLKTKVPAHRADINQDYQYLQNMAQANKQQEIVDQWVRDKMDNIYIRIHKDFKNCDFEYENWAK